MSDRKFFWLVMSVVAGVVAGCYLVGAGAIASMGIMIVPIAYLIRQNKKS